MPLSDLTRGLDVVYLFLVTSPVFWPPATYGNTTKDTYALKCLKYNKVDEGIPVSTRGQRR